MTVNEIFAKINNHMLEGIMLHDQLASYYDFLDLAGYKRCHKYHVQDEMNARRKLLEYYTCHYGYAVPEAQAISKCDISKVMVIIDELMSTIQFVNPKLYEAVMRKINEI